MVELTPVRNAGGTFPETPYEYQTNCMCFRQSRNYAHI